MLLAQPRTTKPNPLNPTPYNPEQGTLNPKLQRLHHGLAWRGSSASRAYEDKRSERESVENSNSYSEMFSAKVPKRAHERLP